MIKNIALICVLVVTLLFSGCKLFPQKKKPAPTPKPVPSVVPTPTPAATPTATATGTPMVSPTPAGAKVTKEDIQKRLTAIETSVKKDDWAAANKDVNSLGGEMLSHFPVSGKGKSLMKMASFDADYTKLKASVEVHKKEDALGDIAKMRKNLDQMK